MNSNHDSKFPKLAVLDIDECPLLESIFPSLFVQDLPVLETLKIRRCEGLKHIFGKYQHVESRSLTQLELCQLPDFIDMFGVSNHDSKFPKLAVLDIEECPLLESTFPFLFVQDFPVLDTLKIRRCDGLKHIFGKYQHVEFPSLTQLELCHLPNFINMFQESSHPISSSAIPLPVDEQPQDNSVALESESYSYCLNIWERAQCLQIQSKILYNIKKIDLSEFSKIKSVFIPSIVSKLLLESLTIRNCDELKHIIDFGDHATSSNNWANIFPELEELHIEGCAKLEYILGHDNPDQQDHVKILLHLPKLKFLSLCNLPSLVATCPKRYRTTFPPLAMLELNKCPEDAIKSFGDFKIISEVESLPSSTIKKYGDGKIATPTFSSSTKKPPTVEDVDHGESHETNQTNNQVSLYHDAFMKVTSNIEEHIPKDDDKLRVSKSRPSPSITSPISSQFSSTLSKRDTSQDLGSSLLVELKKLVSKKYLDYEDLSLLTDFFVKHPSVFLKDTSLSNRSKGYAYKCLAELLKFLQTHSVLDVLGSSRSEFVELVQDMRKWSFDKDWLDGVERRALFSDLQFSQDTLRKLLDFKKHVTEEVGEMRLKIYLFNQHVEDLKNQLTSFERLKSSQAVLLSTIKQ